jgi:hypothetical protein
MFSCIGAFVKVVDNFLIYLLLKFHVNWMHGLGIRAVHSWLSKPVAGALLVAVLVIRVFHNYEVWILAWNLL